MTSIKAGKLRALVVSASKRNGLALEVPTKTEAGLPIEHETWASSFAQRERAATSRSV
jgi:tripartite-type tricarboxylate transporter receptor subunit TctC